MTVLIDCCTLHDDTFPFIVMLEYGGGFPSAWGNPDVMQWECIDKANAVTIELRRIKCSLGRIYMFFWLRLSPEYRYPTGCVSPCT